MPKEEDDEFISDIIANPYDPSDAPIIAGVKGMPGKSATQLVRAIEGNAEGLGAIALSLDGIAEAVLELSRAIREQGGNR